ncbi:MAG: porin family protein [Sphaerochaetaceae bacterium]|nr:porin family protein [Sphaerochaetaceae bacterium]
MKKTIAVILVVLCAFAAFAKDGDNKITRLEPSKLVFDVGAALHLPSSEDYGDGTRAGLMGAVTYTPGIISEKFALGVKFQFSVTGEPSKVIKHENGIIESLDFSAGGFLVAKFMWAKSFEPYGAIGFRYNASEVASLSEMRQRWGAAVQAGVHGRLSNSFGVGIEAEYFKAISPDTSDEAGIRLYLSFEI